MREHHTDKVEGSLTRLSLAIFPADLSGAQNFHLFSSRLCIFIGLNLRIHSQGVKGAVKIAASEGFSAKLRKARCRAASSLAMTSQENSLIPCAEY